MRLLILTAIVSLALLALAVVAARPAHAHGEKLTKTQRANANVLRQVFGRFGEQAVRVSWCESRLLTTAHNGQYLGILQMGAWERRTFGHGPTARAQALAARAYFRATGRDWSPWSCRWAAS